LSPINNTTILRRLAKEHPDWRYRQFAEVTGQSVNTVRGTMNRFGFTVKKKGETVKKKVASPPPLSPRPEHVSIASKSMSYRTGYTKLI